MNRPYFTVQLDAASFPATVLINGCPVYRDSGRGQCVVEIPCSDAVASGANTLALALPAPLPPKSLVPMAGFSAIVFVRESGTRRETRTALANLRATASLKQPGATVFATDMPNSERQDVKAEPLEGGVLGSAAFQATTSFPRWAFLDARPVLSHEEARPRIETIYQRVWNALNTRDEAAVRTMFDASMGEYAAAYHLPSVDAAHVSSGPIGLMREAGLRLDPMPPNLRTERFANGRLWRLVNAAGESPISFTNREEGFTSALNMMVSRIGEEWAITH